MTTSTAPVTASRTAEARTAQTAGPSPARLEPQIPAAPQDDHILPPRQRTVPPAERLRPARGAAAATDARKGVAPPSLSATSTASPEFRTPDWVKDAVFYQVFPDRFFNGDAGNDPENTRPWGSKPTVDNFMGGDLNGLAQKMGYLKSLGVNSLYLNPIFTAPSNHKYNTTDYDNVDPAFGGNNAFKHLMETTRRNGMHVMLDGVFNHTSHQHDWFTDVREHGPQSKYWDRYEVYNWPIQYHRDAEGVLRSRDYNSWWDYATLPELNTEHPQVRETFLTGQNAVVKKWMKEYGIDGWRMDVADEVEADFWREARKQIKATDPDAYLLAEKWDDASAMLQGDQFDGAMNYRYFQQPAVSFFAKKEITADDFVNRLKNNYPREAQFAAFNLLSSHDTPRFITEAGGDWYRMRPAAIFQMTYVGAPVIYYGEELGLEGGKDPDSRRAFPWDKVPSSPPVGHESVGDAHRGATSVQPGDAASATAPHARLFELYRKLISTRNAEPVLRRGDFNVLTTHNNDRVVTYRRHIPGQERDAIVALNNDVTGHDVVVPMTGVAGDGTAYVDALTGTRHLVTDGRLHLKNVEGNFGAVLLRDARR